ncbi:MAG: chemotaxis-specific protein-glutamate methyltransferase CheB [Lachnospiraceae bacterium]|nr:chemotaxis-specific protein-glutamate methyltransferase CheB [Lachnospiraceae bacterium]
MEKKNILIVDDSALMRRVESDIIKSDERFDVTDMATNGLEAFDLVTRNSKKYDAVVLDINMPKMNGIEFLEALEKQKIKQKIIIVSTLAKDGAAETIRALELGAFDYVTKPDSFVDAMSDAFKGKLLQCLRYATSLAEDRAIDLIKSTPKVEVKKSEDTPAKTTKTPAAPATAPSTAVKPSAGGVVSPMNPRAILSEAFAPRKPHKTVSGASAKRLIAIASSTGGPKALQQVICKLPRNINAPILIVQHMSEGFTKSLAARLNELSEVKVVEATGGERLEKGTVYLAKGGSQMRVVKKGSEYVIDINTQEPARNGLKPCADIMMESLANLVFDDITCVVLTGMGGDGTMGIRQLNEASNIYVIGQDEATSTVYGMPKVVYEAGLTDVVLPLGQIAEEITKNVGVQ